MATILASVRSERTAGDLRTLRYAAAMLGEREAMVLEVRGWDVHGVGYVDVTLAYRDGTTTTARLGKESVPEELRAGEVVLASSAMNLVVAIRRPDGGVGPPDAPGEP
jgi:hypothetical protein